VAQAFQPVPAQAEACGYIILQEAPMILGFISKQALSLLKTLEYHLKV